MTKPFSVQSYMYQADDVNIQPFRHSAPSKYCQLWFSIDALECAFQRGKLEIRPTKRQVSLQVPAGEATTLTTINMSN